jgi:hypothetical protein
VFECAFRYYSCILVVRAENKKRKQNEKEEEKDAR